MLSRRAFGSAVVTSAVRPRRPLQFCNDEVHVGEPWIQPWQRLPFAAATSHAIIMRSSRKALDSAVQCLQFGCRDQSDSAMTRPSRRAFD